MARASLIRNSVMSLVFAAALTACSGAQNNIPLENLTAAQIYQSAEADLDRGRTKDAAFKFGEIERLYPYSQWAQRALIMQAFSYHKRGDYADSRASAQRYLDFFPAGEDAAYAQYIVALSYYDQIDDVGRDQGLTFKALEALRRVIEHYPDSEYARLAVSKFDQAFDHLAAKEMEIGRYYLKRGYYSAAANRFRTVVEQFQTTSHTPEALFRLIESYLALGLDDEAQTAGAILQRNFPSSPYARDAANLLAGRGLSAVATGDNWLSSIYRQVIRGEWL